MSHVWDRDEDVYDNSIASENHYEEVFFCYGIILVDRSADSEMY